MRYTSPGWKQAEGRDEKGLGRRRGACVCTHRVSPEELVQVVWMVEPSALNRLATSSFVTWVQAGRGGGERESGGHACTRRVGKIERDIASKRAHGVRKYLVELEGGRQQLDAGQAAHVLQQLEQRLRAVTELTDLPCGV